MKQTIDWQKMFADDLYQIGQEYNVNTVTTSDEKTHVVFSETLQGFILNEDFNLPLSKMFKAKIVDIVDGVPRFCIDPMDLFIYKNNHVGVIQLMKGNLVIGSFEGDDDKGWIYKGRKFDFERGMRVSLENVSFIEGCKFEVANIFPVVEEEEDAEDRIDPLKIIHKKWPNEDIAKIRARGSASQFNSVYLGSIYEFNAVNHGLKELSLMKSGYRAKVTSFLPRNCEKGKARVTWITHQGDTKAFSVEIVEARDYNGNVLSKQEFDPNKDSAVYHAAQLKGEVLRVGVYGVGYTYPATVQEDGSFLLPIVNRSYFEKVEAIDIEVINEGEVELQSNAKMAPLKIISIKPVDADKNHYKFMVKLIQIQK